MLDGSPYVLHEQSTHRHERATVHPAEPPVQQPVERLGPLAHRPVLRKGRQVLEAEVHSRALEQQAAGAAQHMRHAY